MADYQDELTRNETRPGKAENLQKRLRFSKPSRKATREAFRTLLNSGVDPDAEVPFPPSVDLAKMFQDELLRYYVAKRPGFTLMMAAALGREDFVKMLLMAGAKPFKVASAQDVCSVDGGKYQHVAIMQALLGASESTMRCRIVVDLDPASHLLARGGDGVSHADFLRP